MVSRLTLLAVSLSATAILLLVWLGLPPGHSTTFNFAWSSQYGQALSWSDPVPRYLPGSWSGFGGHDFFFYAPLPFWFNAVIVDPLCPGCLPSTEFVLGAAVLLVASGFSMFAFLRSFFAAGPAALGAIVYVILPYHLLVDWFERQAAGEFTAYAFFPLIALGIERIRTRAAGGWLLSLGTAGTALSHLPTTLLVGHVFAVLVLVFVVLAPGGLAARLALLARFAWFGLLGLSLSAFYWVPAIALLESVSPNALFHPHFEAWRWLFGRGDPQPQADFALRIFACFLAGLPLLLGAIRAERGGAALSWVLVPVAVAVFLNTAPSEPIWRTWIISRVQFPWRLMTLVDLAAGVAAAVLAARASNRADRLFLVTALLVLLTANAFLARTVRLTLPGITPEETYRDSFAASEYLSPEMTEVLRLRLGKETIGHFDNILMADMVAAMAAEFRAKPAMGQVLDRRPRSLTVLANPGTTVLSLPVQYWALWRAWTATGTSLEIRPNPVFGTLDILAPADGFTAEPITVRLPLHPSERIGIAASLLALALLLATLFRSRRRARP